MSSQSIGFIGGGRITYILLHALKNKNKIPQKVYVSDINNDYLNKLKIHFPEISLHLNDNKKPAEADLVFISLHPPVLIDVLKDIKENLKKDAALISLAPKIPISKITEVTGLEKILRCNPNAPTIINKGYNPVSFSKNFPNNEKNSIKEFLNIFGESPEVPEKNIEAYAITSAMGPTYFWFQLYELFDIAKSIGLDEAGAKKAIMKMMEGAIDTMFNSGLAREEVMNLVPVKPLGDEEENIKNLYRSKLIPLYNKIKT